MFNPLNLYRLIIKNSIQDIQDTKEKVGKIFLSIASSLLFLGIGYRVYADTFLGGKASQRVFAVVALLILAIFVTHIFYVGGVIARRVGPAKFAKNSLVAIAKSVIYILLPVLILTLLIVKFFMK
ncbi:MAG TPA: hypothetical protein VJC09_02125 [Candidatus Saccharimonadales bacterium]|nr:hypothetical protein [Candidatus Saccharimonadales bacterium]